MLSPRRVLARSVVLIVLTLAGCQEPTTTHHSVSASESPNAPSGEEEVFGEIFINGTRDTSGAYSAVLIPFGAATLARLHLHQSSDNSMWANPNTGNPFSAHMFGWFDPRDGGGCGGLTPYLNDDLSARENEIHPPGPGLLPQGKERHCVRPGSYNFGVGNKEFRLDYLQLAADGAGSPIVITNTTAGTSERLETPLYTEPGPPVFDAVVNVDLTLGSWSESRVLDVENVLNDLTATTFTNEPNLAGSELDWFRFSVARSSSAWSLGGQGRFLARLYWDFGINNNIASGYFEPRGGGFGVSVIRHHRFVDHVSTSRTAIVALEAMRPDEQPNDTVNVATRAVQISRASPWPCDTLEAATTWQGTDQLFSAGCSTRGPNIQYRWHFGTGFTWTPWSSDTLYEFIGHAATGGQHVLLEAKNTSTGLTATHDRVVTVNSGQVNLDGPVFVTTKQVNWYYSNISGWWFEHFDPGTHWYPASAEPRNNLGRIWYAGEYTVDLRQQYWAGSELRRGRLPIQVCIPASENCYAFAAATPSPSSAASDMAPEWGLFGGGPWVSWGTSSRPTVARFYDLLGMHDASGEFSAVGWLTSALGTARARSATVAWTAEAAASTDARIIRIQSSGLADSVPYVFGMALDPDVGPSAADDRTGYDSTRGLAYVFDGEHAVGFLLRNDRGANAIASLQQFGLRRWAPVDPRVAWAAQRRGGISLLSGASDVHLLLSAAQQVGSREWVFVVLRASSVAQLRARADEVIAQLGS